MEKSQTPKGQVQNEAASNRIVHGLDACFPGCPSGRDLGPLLPLSGLRTPTLLPVLFHFLHCLVGVGWTLVSRVHVGLVDGDEGLLDVILHCGDRRADGLAAKAMSYQAEMRQTVLYVRLQDRGGPAVPVGCSILMEEVSEFLAHLPVNTVGERYPALDRISPHPQPHPWILLG